MRYTELAKPHLGWNLLSASLLLTLILTAPLGTARDGVVWAAKFFQQPRYPVSDMSRLSETLESKLAIQSMTNVGVDGNGYFSDPYPVRLAPSSGSRNLFFSGTTKAIMSCAYPVSARCFSWTKATIDAGTLSAEIAADGASITNFQNLNVFQDDAGGWHAVLAIGVRSPKHPDHWTVLVHAHPSKDSVTGTAPLAWSADTVLAGSFLNPVDGNYDGKYFEGSGRLYLLYVKNFMPKPALRNEIVIQPMRSPTRAAPEGPTTLLTPGDRYGSLDSEWYGHSQAKLVEAPYIAKVGGKYSLIYSTGAYREADYKAGVAWSDTLIPTPGGRYRKVLKPDVQNIWKEQGRPEVRYLLQSQHPRWPNFTGRQVISPGVASAVRSPDGGWTLYFAGFDPADRPLVSSGVAKADHRRPFFVRLRVAVPSGQAVATASDAELSNWLQPDER